MKYTTTRIGADVLDTLKAYRDDLHEKSLRKSYWPLLDRLISREAEMTAVWNDIARQELTPEQCWTLLEQIFFSGAYGTELEHARLKADHARLSRLNADISGRAAELAAMLEERESILNRNSFYLEHTTDIVRLIDAATGGNGHYRSFLQKPLAALRCQYDGKYWPSLQQLLEVVAGETPEAEFMDYSDEAIVHARGAAVPDFLRRLFSRLHENRAIDGGWNTAHIFLPADLRLTDASLATLATVSLDLNEPVSVDNVKVLRNRLNKAGFAGAWATSVTNPPGK